MGFSENIVLFFISSVPAHLRPLLDLRDHFEAIPQLSRLSPLVYRKPPIWANRGHILGIYEYNVVKRISLLDQQIHDMNDGKFRGWRSTAGVTPAVLRQWLPCFHGHTFSGNRKELIENGFEGLRKTLHIEKARQRQNLYQSISISIQ